MPVPLISMLVTAVVVEVVGMRTAVPATASPWAAAASARTSSTQAEQGAGNGLGGVILRRAHTLILHAT
jgi:hypothetical protein